MYKDFEDSTKDVSFNRLLIVFFVVAALFLLCMIKLFKLQVVSGKNADEITVEAEEDEKGYHYAYIKTLPVRGNIYDRNGNLLAYNKIQYNIELFNSADLPTNAQKNAAIDAFIKLLDKYELEEEFDFPMIIDGNGQLQYTVTDNALYRFLKNCFGLISANDLTEEQRNTTPEELYDYLKNGNSITSMFGIDDSYTREEALEIMKYRYQMYINNPSYAPIRIVSDIPEDIRIIVMENQSIVPCVEISKSYKRVYNDAEYFAHIIGYIGKINESELETFSMEAENSYTPESVVGKLGVEKSYDTYLQGTCGETRVTLNSLGQIVEKEVVSEPVDGLSLYLTVDRESQIAGYYIVEKNIAAILMDSIVNSYSYGSKGKDADDITIPIFEVYNSLVNNNVLDVSFDEKDGLSDAEKRVYNSYSQYETTVYNKIVELLGKGNSTAYNELSSANKGYVDYLYDSLRDSSKLGLITKNVDLESEHFSNFTSGRISVAEFLWQCIENGNVNTDVLGLDEGYYSTDEIYDKMYGFLVEKLKDDLGFTKQIYRTMIFDQAISGRDLCLMLFDQKVIKEDKDSYNGLVNGTLSAYDFIIRKINNLEITPAMLALQPCSGSLVVTDPSSGDTIAMVSYPSYDNNRLTNQIDYDYYSKLYDDLSRPMLCRATQSRTTTGSTFKPLTSVLALTEGIIDTNTTIYDRVKFTKITPSPSCWSKGSHGSLTVSNAIKHSCNYFFFETAYRFSTNENGKYSDEQGINLIRKYASMFGFDNVSGVEISEAMPEISNRDAVRTAIGYYHSFAPIQIAKYVTTVANGGTCYNLTLIDTVKSSDGSVAYEQMPVVYNSLSQVAQSTWDAVHLGMYKVVNDYTLKSTFRGLSVTAAGKTGTAQVSLNDPNNALFISYAPYDDPKICVTVVLPNGYQSSNAAKVASEYYKFYFDKDNYDNLLSGNVYAGKVEGITVGD